MATYDEPSVVGSFSTPTSSGPFPLFSSFQVGGFQSPVKERQEDCTDMTLTQKTVAFQSYHDWTTKGRKRPVGTVLQSHPGERSKRAKWSTSAGTQTRRTGAPELIQVEMEPGEIIKRFATEAHPFSALPELDDFRKRIVIYQGLPDETILRERRRALEYWTARAQALRSKSLSRLFGVADCDLRDFHFKDCPSGLNSPVGTFCHVELWQEMVEASGLPDKKFVESLVQGFPLMGPIQESDCWPKLDPSHPPELLEADLHIRAWDIRKKVIDKVRREKGGGFAAEVWMDSLSDVDKGFASGPFYHIDQLSEKLGTEHWIPMPRFGIKQGTKVRAVDDASASGSGANSWSSMTEKLQVPSLDEIISNIRALRHTCGSSPLGGWVVDEKKAFRQIAVHPDHRRISIIAVYDPCLEKVAFFIMKGHPFGLTASVFNFNRRAHALKWVLSRLFLLLCLNFYDDHFGFCKNSLAEAECDLVKTIFHLLGVTVNEKFQWGNRLNLLGITYSFSEEKLLVLRERKEALIQEILDILSSGSLAPGEAAKLRGKLGFVSGHLSGRHGRSCLLALSERQYARDGSSTVTLPIRRALRLWLTLLDSSHVSRPLFGEQNYNPADFLVFSDGYCPDPRPGVESSPKATRVGWVCFQVPGPAQEEEVTYSSYTVPEHVISEWSSRRTQIMMVEMLGAVMAVEQMSEKMEGKRITLFIDSEAAEAALIKGYSARSDINDLAGYMWDLVAQRDIGLYVARVPTDGNPSDGPSRADFSELERRGARWVTSQPSALLLSSSEWLKDLDRRVSGVAERYSQKLST